MLITRVAPEQRERRGEASIESVKLKAGPPRAPEMRKTKNGTKKAPSRQLTTRNTKSEASSVKRLSSSTAKCEHAARPRARRGAGARIFASIRSDWIFRSV